MLGTGAEDRGKNREVASGKQAEDMGLGGRQEVRQTYTFWGCSFLVSIRKEEIQALTCLPSVQM